MNGTSLVRYCSVMHWSLFQRIKSGLTSRLEWILNTPLGLMRRRGSWTPPSPEAGSHFFGSDQRSHRVPQCDRGPAHFTMKRKYTNIHYLIILKKLFNTNKETVSQVFVYLWWREYLDIAEVGPYGHNASRWKLQLKQYTIFDYNLLYTNSFSKSLCGEKFKFLFVATIDFSSYFSWL